MTSSDNTKTEMIT